ncbi:hypothetical protein XFF6991_180045 [Xanthomonas phaseoli pv. phaseoli]|uniref:Uncharacterized protein n=1 Tax=Xanthomonas campestris pv. phaseoli TaxID=317013 RepID=A0A7Z7IWK7_XANCH|nr:hypothetical protein XFF6991_180045 [Xanthomonas phaseoli pv. phaseoli]
MVGKMAQVLALFVLSLLKPTTCILWAVLIETSKVLLAVQIFLSEIFSARNVSGAFPQ